MSGQWFVANFILGLAPLAIVFISLPPNKRNFEHVCGDGTLFFYSVILAVGLDFDMADSAPDHIPRWLTGGFKTAYPAILVFLAAGYAGALFDRNRGNPPSDGKAVALVSSAVAGFFFVAVSAVRIMYSLW